MSTVEQAANPFWLSGNYAPVLDEITALDLPVTGSVPSDLQGLYVRNGANPQSGWSSHWFFGNGMLHGVRLEGGGAAGTAIGTCAPRSTRSTATERRPSWSSTAR